MKYLYIKAYFTVEAAFLFPAVFLVYFFLIYIGFFQYNRCLLEQETRLAALEGARGYQGSHEEAAGRADRFITESDRNKYVGLVLGEAGASAGQDRVKVRMAGYMAVPLFRDIPFLSHGIWEMKGQAEMQLQDPVFFIRLCKRITGGKADDEGNSKESRQNIFENGMWQTGN